MLSGPYPRTTAALAAVLSEGRTGTGAIVCAIDATLTTPTISGQAKFPNGGASAPSLSNLAGTTGIFFSATPALGVSVGGTLRAVFDGNDIYLNQGASLYGVGTGSYVTFDNTNARLSLGAGGGHRVRVHTTGVRIEQGVTANPEASCLLDLVSATQALGLPASATAAFSATRAGALRYDSTLNKLSVWTGAAWEVVTSA